MFSAGYLFGYGYFVGCYGRRYRRVLHTTRIRRTTRFSPFTLDSAADYTTIIAPSPQHPQWLGHF